MHSHHQLASTPPPACTIAIVEDEPVLRDEMAFQLRHLGFAVETFEGAASFYRYLAVWPRTIAVLDIGLAGEDGLSVCRYLRTHDSDMGIVFLTARGQRDDRLTGLSAGADAYLTKPVDMDELVLILKRLALRFKAVPVPASEPFATAVAPWCVEPGLGFMTAPNGVRIRLTMSEAQLLHLFSSKAGAVCNQAEMALALGLHPEEFNKHRAEVIVSRLRSKVERAAGVSLPLQAVRGVGYALQL